MTLRKLSVSCVRRYPFEKDEFWHFLCKSDSHFRDSICTSTNASIGERENSKISLSSTEAVLIEYIRLRSQLFRPKSRGEVVEHQQDIKFPETLSKYILICSSLDWRVKET